MKDTIMNLNSIISNDPFLQECMEAKAELDKLMGLPLDEIAAGSSKKLFSGAGHELKISQDPNHTGGRKFDGGKLQYGLLPVLALEQVVKVLTYGAEKYEPDNWKRVPDGHRRYFDAAQRHIWDYKAGEMVDPESGVNHLAHAICCLMFMLHIDEQQFGE